MRLATAASLVLISCCGCCCGRIPTFGLGPALDDDTILAELRAKPFVVDHICTTEQTCEVVDDATIRTMPVGFNPLTGTVVALVEVEATCRASTSLLERAQPFVCRGVLAAVGVPNPDGVLQVFVTEETLFGLSSAGTPRGSSGGGDWDWD